VIAVVSLRHGALPMGHWTLGHGRDFDIIQEIESGSDRVTIIVGLAFVDDRLSDAIRASLQKVGAPTLDKWFGERGYYKDFQIKIDIALMLGIIGKVTYADLILLGRARNEVSHRARHKIFQAATIKGYCRDLKFPERLGKVTDDWTNRKDPKERFIFTVSKITDLLGLWTYVATNKLRRRKPPLKARLP
jgi:hypothetical protein